MDQAQHLLTHICQSLGNGQAIFDFSPLMKIQGPVEMIETNARGATRSELALSSLMREVSQRAYPYIHQWVLQILTSRQHRNSLVEHVHIQRSFEAFMAQQTDLHFVVTDYEEVSDSLHLRLLLWTSPDNQPVPKYRPKRSA